VGAMAEAITEVAAAAMEINHTVDNSKAGILRVLVAMAAMAGNKGDSKVDNRVDHKAGNRVATVMALLDELLYFPIEAVEMCGVPGASKGSST